jgi:hypothetical protein
MSDASMASNSARSASNRLIDDCKWTTPLDSWLRTLQSGIL